MTLAWAILDPKISLMNWFIRCKLQKAFEALSHSTHLYGRRLVLEWAAPDDGVEELRKRTAEQFHGSESAAKRNRKSVFDASQITKVDENSGDDE